MPIESMKINKNPSLTDPQMTFEEVARRVKAMGFNEDLTSRLLHKARSMPPGSLGYFVNNINTFLANLTQGKKLPTPEIEPEVDDGNETEQT